MGCGLQLILKAESLVATERESIAAAAADALIAEQTAIASRSAAAVDAAAEQTAQLEHTYEPAPANSRHRPQSLGLSMSVFVCCVLCLVLG